MIYQWEGCVKNKKRHEVTHLFDSISPGKDEPQASQSLFPLKQMAARAAFYFFTQSDHDLSMGGMRKK